MPTAKKNDKKTKAPRPERIVRKPRVSTRFTEDSQNAISMPADYTYKKITELKETRPESARKNRLGIEATTLGKHNKYLTQSFWLNHNSIRTTKNIDTMIESVIEYPERLAFLDLSHNQLSEIDKSLLKFKNLTVLYLHDNKISNMAEVYKLRELKKLHNLTLFANPVYQAGIVNIRTVVKKIVPQIRKLDFNLFTPVESTLSVSGDVLRFLEKMGGKEPPYIPSKKINKRVGKAQFDVKDSEGKLGTRRGKLEIAQEITFDCFCCSVK